MQSKAAHSELTCTGCHSSHAFDTKQAAVASCSGCHADDHTKAYEGSPHHKLLVAELSGIAEKGTGVSCATCHLPRAWMEAPGGYEEVLAANHNTLTVWSATAPTVVALALLLGGVLALTTGRWPLAGVLLALSVLSYELTAPPAIAAVVLLPAKVLLTTCPVPKMESQTAPPWRSASLPVKVLRLINRFSSSRPPAWSSSM